MKLAMDELFEVPGLEVGTASSLWAEETREVIRAAAGAIIKARMDGMLTHSPESWRSEDVMWHIAKHSIHITNYLYKALTGNDRLGADKNSLEHAICRLVMAYALNQEAKDDEVRFTNGG